MTPTADTKPMKPSEVATLLGVNERTVRRYITNGVLAGEVLPGGHYRISAAAIGECLARARANKLRAPRRSTNTNLPTPDAPTPTPSSAETRARREGAKKRRPRLGAPASASGAVVDLSDDALRALSARRAA
jgi:excisionase family DNA binding protein